MDLTYSMLILNYFIVREKQEEVNPEYFFVGCNSTHETPTKTFIWSKFWHRAKEFETPQVATEFIQDHLNHVDCEVSSSFDYEM